VEGLVAYPQTCFSLKVGLKHGGSRSHSQFYLHRHARRTYSATIPHALLIKVDGVHPLRIERSSNRGDTLKLIAVGAAVPLLPIAFLFSSCRRIAAS
jgi:hypothetical protein